MLPQLIMVAVVGYIAGRYIFRDGFFSAGWNRGTLAQYGAVIGLALFLWVVPTLMDIGSGSLFWPDTPGPALTVLVPAIFATTFIPGFGEEFEFDTTRDSLLVLVGSGPFNSIRATLMINVIGIILLVRGKWKSLEEFRLPGGMAQPDGLPRHSFRGCPIHTFI